MRFSRNPALTGFTSLLLIATTPSIAQQSADPHAAQSLQQGATKTDQPLQLTLADALTRAKKLSPTLANALAQSKLAADAAIQARAAVLPNVTGISQYLYTEGNGTLAARFIANNGVHEYIAQADVHQAISGPLFFQYSRAALLKAIAQDQFTIAQRGSATSPTLRSQSSSSSFPRILLSCATGRPSLPTRSPRFTELSAS